MLLPITDLVLMSLGAKHVESPFIEFGQISVIEYYLNEYFPQTMAMNAGDPNPPFPGSSQAGSYQAGSSQAGQAQAGPGQAQPGPAQPGQLHQPAD
ncbi:hypothetical protein O1611_g8 [Lasiodiplodia mahajangana]|uniref:Uncharacterized protein n=1 Tax=Lasiodiplodia mahajangana TaxID=1108764 RepID=A0ACC2K1I6_9PEZI|nr:hypothetical protein O1611_g8 [Lasiodiplodia mahajangana]